MVSADTGMIINSCISIGLSACSPPLIMFIIGTGRVRADVPPIYLYRGWLVKSAAAFAIAKDTPKIAFAPSRDLLLVPSNSIIASSSSTCSRASAPTSASAISPFTNSTACNTPFPKYRDLSPSLSSTAS